MASSRGKASATLGDLEINGTVAYDHLERASKIEGNFGADVSFETPSLDGSLSSESSWTVAGQGSAAGSLTFTVAPDRTYCAFTNLPIMANWTGTVMVSAAVTVDENGSASGTAEAALTLSVH